MAKFEKESVGVPQQRGIKIMLLGGKLSENGEIKHDVHLN